MRLEVPGLSRDEIKLSVERDTLTIRGESYVNADSVKASLENGVLTIRIPAARRRGRGRSRSRVRPSARRSTLRSAAGRANVRARRAPRPRALFLFEIPLPPAHHPPL
ncbi:MAG: Hsp20/alpha crystallin family protein, partial [Gemmatimonadota bacterium]